MRAVDWPLLLEELRLTKLSFREIAKVVEVSHVALINYSAMTSSPLHANGERLIEFWCQRTGKVRQQVPMTECVVIRHRAGAW
jgi:hypothetical protein